MKYNGIYPWQSETWVKLLGLRSRMPHALLLQGRAGIGKLDFARQLSQALLCDHPLANNHACQTCQSCNWFQQNNHPDFRLIEPDETDIGAEDDTTAASRSARKSQISIDQVRGLNDFLTLSSHRAGMRIVLLHPADALNIASANALLKMLEEPPAEVVFLLVTHHPQRLLPTIRSRCNAIDMPMPNRAVAEAWLEADGVGQAAERLAYVGGSPINAMTEDALFGKDVMEFYAQLMQGAQMDPFVASALCSREGMFELVNRLQKWIYDLISLRTTGTARYHVSLIQSLQPLAKRVDFGKLLDFQHMLGQACRHANHPLNPDLQRESLMIQYSQMFTVKT